MMTDQAAGGIQHQLEQLYAEREQLAREIGVCDLEGVISLVKSLEMQLCDLYQRYGGVADLGNAAANALLAQVQQLSGQLDEQFGTRSITLEIVDDKPVMRAEWKQTLNQGASE